VGDDEAPTGREVRRRPALADDRSGKVVFLSHCLLNQNTRYLGGAVCPGVVDAAVEPYSGDGVGLVQMPCPEQRVWGGVLKRHLLWLLDHPRTARASRALVPVVRPYLRWRYRRLARRVGHDVDDYERSGMAPVAVVGVAGSPSCGVHTTVDLTRAGLAVGAGPRERDERVWMNEVVVAGATTPGPGLFVEALTAELGRRRLDVPVREHDLAPVDGARGEGEQPPGAESSS
jgi:predicted secreted protein